MGSQRDGGYAWFVLATSFVCHALSIGFSLGCIGVATVSFAKAFPNATSSELSWIGSLRGSTQFLASLAAIPLSERLGLQLVTVMGSLLAAAGVAASIFAKEMWHVYVAFGVIGGVGLACPFSTSMTVLGEYFDKHKHIAFPVVGFGQGVGILVFPPVLQAVTDAAGHTNALVFSAAILGSNALCGLTFKPLDSDLFGRCRLQTTSAKYLRLVEPEETTSLIHRGSSERRPTGRPPQSAAVEVSAFLKVLLSKDTIYDGIVEERKDGVPSAENRGHQHTDSPGAGHAELVSNERYPAVYASAYDAATDDALGDVGDRLAVKLDADYPAPAGGHGGDATPASNKAGVAENITARTCSSETEMRTGLFALLSKWEVWAHILNPFFWGACSSAVEALWPLLATSHEISEADAALGFTLHGVGFLAASIVMCVLGRRQYDRWLLYLVAAAMCGVCVLLLPSAPLVLASYLALSTLFGWWLGIVVALFMSVLSDVVEQRDFSDLIALYNFTNGVGYFVGPIMIGSLQASAGELASWSICGCFSIAAALVVVPSYVAFRRRQKTADVAAAKSEAQAATTDCGFE